MQVDAAAHCMRACYSLLRPSPFEIPLSVSLSLFLSTFAQVSSNVLPHACIPCRITFLAANALILISLFIMRQTARGQECQKVIRRKKKREGIILTRYIFIHVAEEHLFIRYANFDDLTLRLVLSNFSKSISKSMATILIIIARSIELPRTHQLAYP